MAALVFYCSRGLRPSTRSGQLPRRPAERCEILGSGRRGNLAMVSTATPKRAKAGSPSRTFSSINFSPQRSQREEPAIECNVTLPLRPPCPLWSNSREHQTFIRLALHRPNGANGMNTPCWEAGGWTALVGGNPTERIGRSRVNDIEHVAIGNGAEGSAT